MNALLLVILTGVEKIRSAMNAHTDQHNVTIRLLLEAAKREEMIYNEMVHVRIAVGDGFAGNRGDIVALGKAVAELSIENAKLADGLSVALTDLADIREAIKEIQSSTTNKEWRQVILLGTPVSQ